MEHAHAHTPVTRTSDEVPATPADTPNLQTMLRLLSEFNIELRITTRRDRKPVFVWRQGQGNLGKGLLITDEILLKKLGIDLIDLLEANRGR
ncbi:MAG: hypothetical protein WC145_13610 [Aliarcobacter sp.]|jgi:hypothetical protein